MKRAITMSLALALFVAGCEEEKKPTPPPPAPKPAATSTELTNEQLDKEPLPVEEDFVAEADQQITEENLDDTVTELQKEIGGEGTEPASDKKDKKDEEVDEDSFD
jgi:hypothetical protein